MNMGRGYEWRTVCFHFVKKRKYVRGKLSEVDVKLQMSITTIQTEVLLILKIFKFEGKFAGYYEPEVYNNLSVGMWLRIFRPPNQ